MYYIYVASKTFSREFSSCGTVHLVFWCIVFSSSIYTLVCNRLPARPLTNRRAGFHLPVNVV